MATELGNAYVNIVPKARGIESKVENMLNGGGGGAEKAGQGLGKRLLSGIAGLGIGVAVGNLVKSAFEAGGALEQSFGGLETIYGDAAEMGKEYAASAAAAGISMNTYAENAVSFGAALKSAFEGDTWAAMDAADTAILDMADNSAKMGTSMESVQNAYQGFAKGNYTMLDNLKLGYGGTRAEMERLIDDANAINAANGMATDYSIENLGDVYAAIHTVQGELGITGVAADEAASTLQGSMGSMKASWENVMAALTTGEGLDTAMENLTTSVGNFAENVLRMLGELGPQLPGMILGLADVIVENAPDFIASGAELILQLAVGLIEGIPDLIAKVPEIFDSLKEAFGTIDWPTLGKSIVDGIIVGLDSMLTSLVESAKSLGSAALDGIKEFLHIGSPSKVFADEVGRWIPAGVAEGIDDNTFAVDRSVRTMAASSLRSVTPAQDTMQGGTLDGASVQQIVDALASRPVVIEGDTSKIFRVVNRTNQSRTRATAYNALAGGMA